jgi:hypothetical protein
MVSNSKGRDTLIKTAKGWLFKTVETLEDKTTIDGKPFTAQMIAPPANKPSRK